MFFLVIAVVVVNSTEQNAAQMLHATSVLNDDGNYKADQQHRNPQRRPLGYSVTQTTPASDDGQADDKSHEWPDERFFRWLRGAGISVGRWLNSATGAAWALNLITLAAVLAALGSLRILRRQTRASVAAAKAAKASADAVVMAERAYVDISHDPPGLQMGNDIRFSVTIRNHGRTPAYVSSPLMILAISEIPNLPPQLPYGSTVIQPTTFLMPGQTFHKWELFPQFPEVDVQMINSGQRTLWLFGYVDYRDTFRALHRGGYARRYIPTPLPGSTNNLVFVSEPGYNYDIRIDEQGNPQN
jgi:hypothetical protein